MNKKVITPIGFIKTDFKEKFGIPRQSGRSPSSLGEVIFYKPFSSPDAFREITAFSHLWIIFDFSLCSSDKFTPLVRPPRLGGNAKVGVFASRSPFRPNNLGLSLVKLEKVNFSEDGVTLTVSGVDLLDGTPIYDVKPYIPLADCKLDAVGGYSDKFACYKLSVVYDEKILQIIPKEKRQALLECLSDDPRPSYQDDDRIYGMKFDHFNVKFSVKDGVLNIITVEKDKSSL